MTPPVGSLRKLMLISGAAAFFSLSKTGESVYKVGLEEPEVSYSENEEYGSKIVNIGVIHTDPKIGEQNNNTHVESHLFVKPNGGFMLERMQTPELSYLLEENKSRFLRMRKNRSDPNYLKVIEEIECSNVPYFCGDMVLTKEELSEFRELYIYFQRDNATRLRLIMPKMITAALGMVLPNSNVVSKLDHLADPFFALGVWLSTAAAEVGLTVKRGGTEEVERIADAAMIDMLHPESLMLTMRNIMLALKINDLYKQSYISQGDALHLIYGVYHKSLGVYVADPEFGQLLWKTFQYGRILNNHYKGQIPDWLWKTSMYLPGTDELVVIEHPDLKKLFEV